jgi:hypothetical protein
MEKQEAIEFIQKELEQNRSQAEIVVALSQQLGAPPEIVARFVSQTIANSPLSQAPQTPETKLGEPQASSESPTLQATEAPPNESLPSFTSETPPEEPPVIEESPARYPDWSDPFYTQADESPSTMVEPESIDVPATIKIAAPQSETDFFPAEDASSPRSSTSEVDSELEKEIVRELSRNMRQSDVIVMVCEKTGLSWDSAQRLVARVSMKNRKKLASRQNFIMLPMALIFIVAGLALVGASGSEMLTFINVLINPNAVPPGTTPHVSRSTISYFVLGVLLILGGAVGLFRALQNQFG